MHPWMSSIKLSYLSLTTRLSREPSHIPPSDAIRDAEGRGGNSAKGIPEQELMPPMHLSYAHSAQREDPGFRHDNKHLSAAQSVNAATHPTHPLLNPKPLPQEVMHDFPFKRQLTMHPWISSIKLSYLSLTTRLSPEL